MLSYPASQAQLQTIEPDLDKKSQDFTWATDQNPLTEQTTWNTGTTDRQTVSFDQNYSFDNKLTVSGVGSAPFVKAEGSVSLDLSGSFGFSTLHTGGPRSRSPAGSG